MGCTSQKHRLFCLPFMTMIASLPMQSLGRYKLGRLLGPIGTIKKRSNITSDVVGSFPRKGPRKYRVTHNHDGTWDVTLQKAWALLLLEPILVISLIVAVVWWIPGFLFLVIPRLFKRDDAHYRAGSHTSVPLMFLTAVPGKRDV